MQRKNNNIYSTHFACPSFSKVELGEVYQIGFNHGKHVAPFQKDRIVEAYCKADEWYKNINWK